MIATGVVLLLSFVIFHHLNALNNDIDAIAEHTKDVTRITDSARSSMISILKSQRKLFKSQVPIESIVNSMIQDCDNFTNRLKSIETYSQEPEMQKIVTQMLSYGESLKLLLKKNILSSRNNEGRETVGDLAEKILESFSQFQNIQYADNLGQDKRMKKMVNESKQRMMLVLLIGFLFSTLLTVLVPGKITLPFKKLKEAIRELRDCNFDVNIYYSANDEIGELSQEMNKMIHAFKVFDELRTDRISVENRKFDALANMTALLILVANNEGKLIYMNNQLYSLLQVQSEEVIGKEMGLPSSAIPAPLSEACQLAIKRRSKMENLEITINAKHPQEREGAEQDAENQKPAFQGYATITPIRGKDSSLDYYLMVLSKNPLA